MKYEKLDKNLRKELILLSKKYNLKLLILFGSRSNGNYKKNSDWDFAFYPNSNFTINEEISLFDDLMKILSFEKIDLLNIIKANDLRVLNNVFQTGILVYESKKGLFVNKKWSCFIDLKDFEKYYELQSNLTQKKLESML